MKYCPYCGAAIIGGAAPFCAECGKELPAAVKTTDRVSPSPKRPPHTGNRRQGAGKPTSNKSGAGKSRPDTRREPPRRPKPDPRDEGYDGYYDDIKPIDDGRVREQMDPELIKRIIMLAGGAFLIVIFAVILMYVL